MSYLSLRWVIKGASLFVVGLGALSVPALSSSKSALPRLVKDIVPGYGDNIQQLTNVNGTLFFTANDKLPSNTRLWKSDGTAAGTVLVKDINPEDIYPGVNHSYPQDFINANGTLYFKTFLGTDFDLWKSNGTAKGTVLVQKRVASTGNSLALVNGKLYFTGRYGDNLFVIDEP